MQTGLTSVHSRRERETTGIGLRFATRYARFGAFDLDLQKQELFKDGSRIRLQGKVSQALLTLLEKPGETVTREELRLRLWPADGRIFNYQANVNTTVNKLRLLLGDSTEQPLYVETIPRIGYSFIAKVEYGEQLPAREFTTPKATVSATENSPAAKPRASKSSLFLEARPSTWFTAGVIALVIAGMLLGAAIVILSRAS